MLDTIEDAALAPDARAGLFEAFDACLQRAHGAGALERGFASLLGADVPTAEQRLARGCGAVLRAFAALPQLDREAICGPVLTMSEGMRRYSEHGHQISDLDDLERYCYHVAGTVGELLDSLFFERCPATSGAARRERAVGFGIGLQLVNIVKDVAEDLSRGRCFLPVEGLRAAGLQPQELLVDHKRDLALAVLEPLIELADDRLDGAAIYTCDWPAGDRQGRAIRLFCAVPLAIARATLALARRGTATLRRGVALKVARTEVGAIVDAAVAAAPADDGRLEALVARRS